MVIVEIKGGLGNQMFQVALAIILQQNQKNVKISQEQFQYAQTKKGKRLLADHGKKYLINDLFALEFSIASKKELDKYSVSRMNLISRIKRRLGRTPQSHIVEMKYDFPNLDFLLSCDECFLDGYWQRFDYYSGKEDLIRKSFKFVKELNEKNQSILSTVSNQNSVSIHVRRSDYIGSNFYTVQTEEYYKKAISFFAEKEKDFYFYCFSDDIEWCKNVFRTINIQIEYIDWNKGADSYIDMQIMSACSHNIITNSTFSMWAAWLNNNPNKIVIRPQHYYNDAEMDSKVYWPDSWISI